MLIAHGVVGPISRRGDPLDTARAEALMQFLKV